jgi:ribosomal-protein-alanine N-acetyltransferase
MRVADAKGMLALRVANRYFFEPWEPDSSRELYTPEGQRRDLVQREDDWHTDRRYSFAIAAPDGEIVGGIVLSNVIRGALQSANVGYYVAEKHNGRGIATEAVRQVVRFAFEEIGLHRVEAGVMPHNPRSMRVLEKAGFTRIGFAPHYLKLRGGWKDHHLFQITSEDIAG